MARAKQWRFALEVFNELAARQLFREKRGIKSHLKEIKGAEGARK